MATKNNPLDGFVGVTSPGTLKLPPVPNLGEYISSLGFKEGHAKHHEMMVTWVQQVEELLNERLATKPTVSTGKVQ